MPRQAWVYIVECADGTLYTGWSYDVAQRVAAHNAGQGARYTRGRTPVRLRWCEAHPTRRAAMQREAALKKLRRTAKWRLIEGGVDANGRNS
ncbi:MAG: GIY-YIG nuclease family protein [Anaerolineales bacterium]|nr:GIY-YIG nuclease family protein [Anaerolineales bacterium]MCB9126616.1 GIY-YIG nuclease family protein [Ardenticatenales bacterium]